MFGRVIKSWNTSSLFLSKSDSIETTCLLASLDIVLLYMPFQIGLFD